MPTYRYEKVKSAKHLKELTAGDNHMEFKLLLSHGLVSRKQVCWVEDEQKFHIYNYIDDTEQMLGPRQLFNRQYTNIGEAIKKGAFVYEVEVKIDWEKASREQREERLREILSTWEQKDLIESLLAALTQEEQVRWIKEWEEE